MYLSSFSCESFTIDDVNLGLTNHRWLNLRLEGQPRPGDADFFYCPYLVEWSLCSRNSKEYPFLGEPAGTSGVVYVGDKKGGEVEDSQGAGVATDTRIFTHVHWVCRRSTPLRSNPVRSKGWVSTVRPFYSPAEWSVAPTLHSWKSPS